MVERSSAKLRQIASNCEDLANDLRSRTGGPLTDLVTLVRALPGQFEIDLSGSRIAAILKTEPTTCVEAITLTAPYRLTRTGRALRLIKDDGSRVEAKADPALVKLLAKARRWWSILAQGEIDITALAAREGITYSYITRIVRLAFLSPDLVEAIMAGRQRCDLDAKVLRKAGALPLRWDDQHRQYA